MNVQKTAKEYSKLKGRAAKGAVQLEFPLVMFVMFLTLLFPVLDLVMVGARMAMVNTAVRQSAEVAARAFNWPDAKATALDMVETSVGSINGVGICKDHITVTQNVRPITDDGDGVTNSNSVVRPNENIYEMELRADTRIEPFIKISPLVFGNAQIGGVTAPLLYTSGAHAFLEHPNLAGE